MKKWVVPLLSILLVFGFVYLSSPFNFFKITIHRGDQGQKGRVKLTPIDEGEREEGDSTEYQLFKKIQEKLDEWLKSINERIESEDVSRLEVRFLEMLRNVLEWVKEKVDKKVESSKGKGSREKNPFKEI